MNVTTKAAPSTRKTTSTDTRAGKYLSFHLASEEYAIQVIKVREIVKLQHITTVPETPPELKGVINLRGKVIPVIDLRLRFALPTKEYDQLTCIVVVELSRSGCGPMGLIVDNVNEVMMLQESDIQDTPNFGIGVETPYLLGMAKMEDGVKILLDIDEVLATADLSALTALAS
ncbi:MAG TPA: chemotaxis protein CheW [Bryobacteraceae bacterium]|nr:chemotaxis protein CheW [Bryobacteraceae bacterium]